MASHRSTAVCSTCTVRTGYRPSREFDGDIIENIDIGGPAMLRSAAKNFARVAVATDPAQYAGIADEVERERWRAVGGHALRAVGRAFNRVAQYDASISNYLSSLDDGSRSCSGAEQQQLRQGDGPALRRESAPARRVLPRPASRAGHLATFTQLQGKELSYNNLADADAAWECVRQFQRPACVIVKHANPAAWRGRRLPGHVRSGLRHRPDLRVRRDHRLQPHAGRHHRQVILDRQFVEVLIAGLRRRASPTREKANVREVLKIRMAKEGGTTSTSSASASGLLMQTSDIREVTSR